MSILLSPGVSINEVDLTTIVPSVASSPGGFAGMFNWGPVNHPVLIDSETTLKNTFQRPSSNTSVFFYTAANFLAYTNAINVVRANSAGLYNATANGAPDVLVANNDTYFVNNLNGNSNVYGMWFARYAGDLGNSLIVSMCPSANAFRQDLTATLSITANAGFGNTTVEANSSLVSTLVQPGDLLQVGSGSSTNGFISVVAVSGNTITLATGPVTVSGGSTTASLVRKWKYADQFTAAPGTSPYAASKGGIGDQMHIIVVDANSVFNGSTTNNYVLEKFPFVSKASDAKNQDNSPNYYVQVLYNQSQYIYWADHLPSGTNWGSPALDTTFTAVDTPNTVKLSGGGAGAGYNYTSFVGGYSDPNDANLIAAWSYLIDPDMTTVSLLPTGPASPALAQWVIANVAEVRKDCVAFVSPRYSDVVNQQGNELNNIVNSYIPALNYSSSYAVADSAWKYQLDQYAKIYRYFPLNGDVAGLCARTDQQRDPWYSPAGYNRGIIKNVVKLSWTPGAAPSAFNPNQTYRDVLYSNGVNPVITQKGAGTLLFGDKTLQFQPSAFDRINVRRLFIILEKSISTAAKFSLFEFNDAFTRAQFRSMVEPYLRSVKGRRGIYDFKVICDETNNTPQIIDSNQFVGDIYIKPARSINTIQLNFVAVGTGVDFNTIVNPNT